MRLHLGTEHAGQCASVMWEKQALQGEHGESHGNRLSSKASVEE